MNLAYQVEPLCIRITTPAREQRGNAVFIGVEVSPQTMTKMVSDVYFIVCINDNDAGIYCDELKKGAIVELIPNTFIQKRVKRDGFIDTQVHISASSFSLLRPSGELIVNLLAGSSRFKGIGPRKAEKLWTEIGDELYQILDDGDTEKLLSVLTAETATQLVESWQSYVVTDALLYCNRKLRLTASTAFKIIRYYKSDTITKIKEDPYRLISFGLSFEKCDEIASEFGIKHDDNRRLSAAVEAALYKILDNGDTIANKEFVFSKVMDHLKNEALSNQALESDLESKSFIELDNGHYQAAGPAIMESFVARRFVELIHADYQSGFDFFDCNVVNEYETLKSIHLTSKQKEAVKGAVSNRVFLINGGAGVGKTTVLEAVYACFESAGIEPIQLAIAAKAAMRMTEATGRESQTIARFIKRFDFEDVNVNSVALVIDESSMVDLSSMYQLLCKVPLGVKVILVGDVGQLPPIGFGLILHELIKVAALNSVTLTEVKRQGKNSSIPAVAESIRRGVTPHFNQHDVNFLECQNLKAISDTVLGIFKNNPNVQIICPTRKLVKKLNEICAGENKRKNLLVYSDYLEYKEDTGFRLGDNVMCLSNLYELGVMNGSLGQITACYNEKRIIEVTFEDTTRSIESCGRIKWEDGVEREITEDIIDNIEHSYAMTIHKSQGSQFEEIVIPIVKSRNFDRSMLYTAVTRAKKRVTFVGEQSLVQQVIQRVSVDNRKSGLADKIFTLLKEPEFGQEVPQSN